MKCYICQKEIIKYNPELNHIDIQENISIDLCLTCVDKITNWQKRVFVKLFPTKKLKKIIK